MFIRPAGRLETVAKFDLTLSAEGTKTLTHEFLETTNSQHIEDLTNIGF